MPLIAESFCLLGELLLKLMRVIYYRFRYGAILVGTTVLVVIRGGGLMEEDHRAGMAQRTRML